MKCNYCKRQATYQSEKISPKLFVCKACMKKHPSDDYCLISRSVTSQKRGEEMSVSETVSKYLKVAVSIPISVLDELDGFCKERGYSRSGAITEAVRRLIKKEKR